MMKGGFFRGSRRQRGGGGIYHQGARRRKRGGVYRGSRRQRGGQRRKKTQRGGIGPLLIPLIAAGISAAGGIGSAAAHAAISKQ